MASALKKGDQERTAPVGMKPQRSSWPSLPAVISSCLSVQKHATGERDGASKDACPTPRWRILPGPESMMLTLPSHWPAATMPASFEKATLDTESKLTRDEPVHRRDVSEAA